MGIEKDKDDDINDVDFTLVPKSPSSVVHKEHIWL